MKKILLIIKREYLSRVRKRSFVIMTLIGPLLMAAVLIVPIYIAQKSDEHKEIGVIDETYVFVNNLPNTENIHFTFLKEDLNTAKSSLDKSKYYAILHIPGVSFYSPAAIRLYSMHQPSLSVKLYIEGAIKKLMEDRKLEASGIDKQLLASTKTKIDITTIKLSDDGEEKESSTAVATGLGIFAGLIIYMFIFMYGSQVMRGVIEEKTSRIVEVIVSSVRPFQLMMGKIIGVAMVGLTQFLLWVLLTFGIMTVIQASFPNTFKQKQTTQTYDNKRITSITELQADTKPVQEENSEMSSVIKSIRAINFGVMILSFLFFFLFGYLLYAAFFAAIGSAVDSEADTQQFMLPLTIPLIFAMVMNQFIINNPDGPVAFWLSIIPLTSPVVMMMRIPFGVPWTEIVLSAVLLILGFWGSVWLASKIYRTGILMYGKKISYKELWKWLTYKS
jgi:ABC-2 type transport system permease protein